MLADKAKRPAFQALPWDKKNLRCRFNKMIHQVQLGYPLVPLHYAPLFDYLTPPSNHLFFQFAKRLHAKMPTTTTSIKPATPSTPTTKAPSQPELFIPPAPVVGKIIIVEFPHGTFYIRHKSNPALYLDANKGLTKKAPTPVHLYTATQNAKHQQWFFDSTTNVIRNVYNDLVLEIKNDKGPGMCIL